MISLTGNKKEYLSQIKDWKKFYDYLKEKNFCPIFILDLSLIENISQLKGYNIFFEATWNVQIRAACYQCCFLNIFVGHGPAELCYYNPYTKYISFLKTTSLDYHPNIERSLVGWQIGKDLPFAKKGQKIVWKDDTFENIKREFKKFVKEN